MPEGFDVPRGTDVWTPVVPILANAGAEWRGDALRDVGVLFLLGRLRVGITPTMAAEELARLATPIAGVDSTTRFGPTVVAVPLITYLMGPVRRALWLLLGAVAVLLCIGCANVSGLMLTRVSARRRDHAIRVALGATSGRLARLWMWETLLLTVTGGVLGLTASAWLVRTIGALAPDDVPRLATISLNLPVAAFTGVVVFVTALLCGYGPTMLARAMNVVDALYDADLHTFGATPHRLRSALVSIQLGLCVVLLVAAGLVTRSFVNLRGIDLGFAPSQVITMTLAPQAAMSSTNAWMDEVLRRVRDVPDVEAAGAVYLRPLALGPIGQETSVVLEGQPDTPDAERRNPVLNYQVATPGYFSAMRIRLKQGRVFNEDDRATSVRVALVSDTAARRLWPNQDAVGKRLLLPTFTPQGPAKAWRTVVLP